MDLDRSITASRLRVSRRRALGIGGLVGVAGVLAACGTDTPANPATTPTAASSADELSALLNQAPRCVMTAEETQGPYWFDVDDIRQDIREDRPGLQLDLALRVQDLARCNADPAVGGVANAVVEIWHCDAGGEYSGFESQSAGPQAGGTPPNGGPGSGGTGPGGAGPGGAGGELSDGSYSTGDAEAVTSDDATYLRGAQTTDADGVVRFTTIFPGWYSGRAVHVHIKVHVDKKTVLTTQLYFDDGFTDGIYASTAPYDARGRARDTRNDSDSIYDKTGLAASALRPERALAALNLGINV